MLLCSTKLDPTFHQHGCEEIMAGVLVEFGLVLLIWIIFQPINMKTHW